MSSRPLAKLQNAVPFSYRVRMNRIAIVALLFFAACFGASSTTGELSPVAVTMCDLYDQPEQYAGKLVEFRAVAMGGVEDLWLEDGSRKKCGEYFRLIAVLPDSVTPNPMFSLVTDQAWQTFASSLPSMRVEANITGIFNPYFVWRDGKRIQIADFSAHLIPKKAQVVRCATCTPKRVRRRRQARSSQGSEKVSRAYFALFCFAQRARCAAAIRARPAALMCRFFGVRPRRVPVEPVPARSARTC